MKLQLLLGIMLRPQDMLKYDRAKRLVRIIGGLADGLTAQLMAVSEPCCGDSMRYLSRDPHISSKH